MNGDNDECPICMEKLGEANFCITDCGHKFCLTCLMSSCLQIILIALYAEKQFAQIQIK